jgi:hypothetical protein
MSSKSLSKNGVQIVTLFNSIQDPQPKFMNLPDSDP